MDINELKAIINANIFENTSQAITGDALNDVLNLIADSLGEYVPVADIFDDSGTIRSALLPSYVDDVLEFSTRDAFPAVGEGGKIYIATDTNLSYRWGGSEYVVIAQSLALGETSSTAYRGDRGKIAYDHSQTSHRLSIAGLEVSALGGSIATDALASALSIPELRNAVAAHIGDGTIHITADERTAWNKIASLFGIDDSGDIYIKSDENGRARGLYSYSFVSSAGKSDTPGTGGGTVVGANIDGVEVPLSDGILSFPAYPTAKSLGLAIADVANLQSSLDGKQAVISDLATIREGSRLGAIAHSWGNHASAGYALASTLTAHTGNSTIHITSAERTSWNNKYDKPASGIPYTDLADSVKSALDKAHEHANKTSVLDKLKWDEDKNAIYIGDENNRINFFVYGGVASAGFSDTPGAGGGTVIGATVGGEEVKLSGGILEFDAYPTTTSLGLKSLAFKDSLSVSEVVGLQSALSNKQDAATAITTSNYTNYALPLSGGTMVNTNIVTNLNADLLDGYHADSFYKHKSLRSDQNSIYDLRFNYGTYDKGDFGGTYAAEYPTNYGTYLALAFDNKNTGALMFFDAPISNALGHIYVRTRGAGDGNTTYSEWGTLAYLTDNVASASKWANARTITLTGSVTGSVSIDGSQNVTLATTTNHTHTFASLADKPTTISGYGITDAYTASTIDSKLSGYLPLSLSSDTYISRSNDNWVVWFRNNSALEGSFIGFDRQGTSLGTIGFTTDGKLYCQIAAQSWAGYDIYHSGNLTASVIGGLGTLSNNISGNAATATNADTLDGYHATSGSNTPWGTIPAITTGGWMDVGRQFEFHYDNTTGNDYSTILRCTGNYGNVVDLPSVNGTLALLTDNVASATKLQTARTIWGQSFDGTANISGNIIGAAGGVNIEFDNEINCYYGPLYLNNRGSIDGYNGGHTSNILALCYGGNFGIGTATPSEKLHVDGNILATGAVTAGQASDARLKSNIVTARNACGILRCLRGVEFDWNAIATENCKDLTGHDVGLIAQEVESLIPSAIGTIWNEYKRLDYAKITPYLVEGWKAHDEEIQRLKTKINKLEERIYELGRKNNGNTYRNR